jgi:hypothetical protein
MKDWWMMFIEIILKDYCCCCNLLPTNEELALPHTNKKCCSYCFREKCILTMSLAMPASNAFVAYVGKLESGVCHISSMNVVKRNAHNSIAFCKKNRELWLLLG